MVREDDAMLLVRHAERRGEPGPFGGRWTLPLAVVAEREAAEDAVARVLREQLHVAPGASEFSDTLYLLGERGERFVVNAFLCVGWAGEPRVSARTYADAAWVAPGRALGLEGDLADGLGEWIATAFDREATAPTPEALEARIGEARGALLAAFDAIAVQARTTALDGEWSPLDLLAHVADVEAYYVAETRRVLGTPGHTWRSFNEAQWEAARALRGRVHGPEEAAAVRARVDAVRAETRRWLAGLTVDDLAAYGNDAERGVVRVADRIDKIARHDEEHAHQLRTMERLARVAGGPLST